MRTLLVCAAPQAWRRASERARPGRQTEGATCLPAPAARSGRGAPPRHAAAPAARARAHVPPAPPVDAPGRPLEPGRGRRRGGTLTRWKKPTRSKMLELKPHVEAPASVCKAGSAAARICGRRFDISTFNVEILTCRGRHFDIERDDVEADMSTCHFQNRNVERPRPTCRQLEIQHRNADMPRQTCRHFDVQRRSVGLVVATSDARHSF